MKPEFSNLDNEIKKMHEELSKVQLALEETKKKHESNSKVKTDALLYIDKAEKIIEQAESGKINLKEDEIHRIKDTLKKIVLLFK